MSPKRVSVYVDGFNLYYGIRRYQGAKWLDLDALCKRILRNYDVRRIKYFTARVSATTRDPDQPSRQQVYWRALRTIPHLEIIEGHFISNVIEVRPLPGPGVPAKVRIEKTEEKGSDVNLATHLIVDAFDNAFDVAAVISNDSDLAPPIEVVRTRFTRDVIVFNPHDPKRMSIDLRRAASEVRPLRQGPATASQFPGRMCDSAGSFRKPSRW